MLRIKKLIPSFIFTILLFASTAIASDKVDITNGVWRIDAWNIPTVRNFRIASPNTSASAQPSEKSLPLIFEVIKKEALSKTTIYLVDLRQESHGFANGFPVSWYKEHNHANLGKSVSEIEQDEIEILQSIVGKSTEFIPLGKHDEATLNKLILIVENVKNEKYLAEQAGFKYVRFSAADMVFPSPETVDEFIKFYISLPKNYWLHFHCHAGQGRTTTFLVLYDILTYPDLTLEEIVQRQVARGGTNLLADNTGNDWYAEQSRDRAKKLRLFYKYVQMQRGTKFSLKWSDWLQNNRDDLIP